MSPSFLYVEDDMMSRQIMKVMLMRKLSYQTVTILEDSANFMEQVEALSPKPDVIFLDIHVKPLDGFAMLGVLRQHPEYHDTTVIALTASVMSEEVEQLRAAGFNGGIAKPIDQDVFPSLLDDILAGKTVWHIV